MKTLIKNISEYITINNSDIEIINKSFSKKEYKKGEYLIEQGKRADKVFFIEKGLVRMYFINENGNEINTYFASDESFITSFSSFINQYSSVEFIKAEKETSVYSLNYSDFETNNDFMIKFRTLFVEQNLVCVKNRLDLLQTSNAKEKYEHFIRNTNEKIINGIPLYHIASYLGITAESLSRLRKKTFLTKSQEK
ncbi:Crp/Fnr family transcriptional regulator [Yeosuana marina]|uniref:Crp/Fnr family transcriptional regulator n=1 Tax=Yeosuana marina TaxID=1565536 RepID=UPI00142427A4|nr:Crp/Fnr family transcriptional regulator [Yeosuana marina]